MRFIAALVGVFFGVCHRLGVELKLRVPARPSYKEKGQQTHSP